MASNNEGPRLTGSETYGSFSADGFSYPFPGRLPYWSIYGFDGEYSGQTQYSYDSGARR